MSSSQKLLLPRHALHSAKLAIEDHREWTSALPPDLAEFCSGGRHEHSAQGAAVCSPPSGDEIALPEFWRSQNAATGQLQDDDRPVS